MILIRTEYCNEIIKLEEKIRHVEERNLTFMNAICKIDVIFSLFANLNSDITTKFTHDCDLIEKNKGHH